MDRLRQIISVTACRLPQFECTNVPETLITSIYLNDELYFSKMLAIAYESTRSYKTQDDNMHLIHSLVFSLEGRTWQEPEPSHVTGMALAHCILGKFLEVVCHCFPPPLDVPTLAARCLRPQRRERS